MDALATEMDMRQELSAAPDPLSFARSYQVEALLKAIKQNTIVFLETGSGKTLIAIMLLRSYSHLLRKPSPFIAVFLVPKVVLVSQQAEAIRKHTDLNVGMYWGDMGVDFWDAATWKQEMLRYEVLVMTPAILLGGLRHSFFKLSMIKILIFDECHHARGKDPYACIMTEFYHQQLQSGESYLPRIFGMTASPIKSKCGKSEFAYWQKIDELETLMNSKVYTCVSESILAEFIPISAPKFKFYKHRKIPCSLYACIKHKLNTLKEKNELLLRQSDFIESTTESAWKRISKSVSDLEFCLEDLGVWLALKAAESLSLSFHESEFFSWGNLDSSAESIVNDFRSEAVKALVTQIPFGPQWSVGDNVKADVDSGMITTKVACLIETLLEYRGLNDLRCIVFVQRVITAVALQMLLSELLPKHKSWTSKYIAGNNSRLRSQTRKRQNEIVDEFRKGLVNIIVATSILEEGLDVQSCNVVIRFDPSPTVCSFIQSRGRARMLNSDYILMVKSEDIHTQSRLKNYLASGDIMRKEALSHSSFPCAPLQSDLCHEDFYRVESTGAIVSLSSSVNLIYFYCSRLPSDGYFKPSPQWDAESGTLYLPKSCPLQPVCVQGDSKVLKKIACLEACKQLHKNGALTDNLIPDIIVEEADVQESGNEPYDDVQPSYVPPELVNCCSNTSDIMYYCYLINLKQKSKNEDIPVHDVVFLIRSELESNIRCIEFELFAERGSLMVNFGFVGVIKLTQDQVELCRRFQITLLRVLLDHNVKKLEEVFDKFCLGETVEHDYLLLPATEINKRPVNGIIDWNSVISLSPLSVKRCQDHKNEISAKGNGHCVWTKNGLVCTCKLKNSLVYTPHTGLVYCITGILELNGDSLIRLKDGNVMSYKEYYAKRHGIQLNFEKEFLLNARRIFQVKNCLQKCRPQKEKESSHTSFELPPELCSIIMSPISISTIYSFSFVPSIMHRLESLLVAFNLKKFHLDNCMQNDISIFKILEAITTKKCQEVFHLESLETLGDSFLKYAASQQLFKTHQNDHEGLLSMKRERIISNASLSQFGCSHKIPGFIQNELFDPKSWIIPGERAGNYSLAEELLSSTSKVYVCGRRNLKRKVIADVVEALIGAFLSASGEKAALLFMSWIGIEVDFEIIPYARIFHVCAEKQVNVRHLESLLNYTFYDTSLLVEALTHGSYMLPEIPRCYQRLEFLGDSVLDYLITMFLYTQYTGLSPGLLTDMRAASVNNDCYARSAIKSELHKHVLHLSQELHRHIVKAVKNFDVFLTEPTFGWELETSFPKVLGDVIESLAGAILVDSGFNKEIVFESMRPLLEPLVTPHTVKLHPVRELNELCQKQNYSKKKPMITRSNGLASVTIEVEANGSAYRYRAEAADLKMAKKVASKEVLKSLKENISTLGAAAGG